MNRPRTPFPRVLLAILCASLWVASAAAQSNEGALGRLEQAALRCAHPKHVWNDERAAAVVEACSSGIALVQRQPELGERWEAALLKLAGSALGRDGAGEEGSPAEQVAEASIGALRATTSRDRKAEFAELLLSPSSTPIGTRRAIARLFLRNPPPRAKLALSLTARESDRTLALLSLESLAGWDDELIHALFVEEIARSLGTEYSTIDRSLELALVELHLSKVELQPDSPAARHLLCVVRDCLRGSDATRAMLSTSWTRAMPHEMALDALVEGLVAWGERFAARTPPALDPRPAIVEEMEQRFGVALGAEPTAWRSWWQDVRKGAAPPPPDRDKLGTGVGSFFGISTMSKRVVFVIDRSGSMSTPHAPGEELGTGGRPRGSTGGPALGTGGGRNPGPANIGQRRWDEAKRQLFLYLSKSPATLQFDVVLFHSAAESFRGKCVPANSQNIAQLRSWLDGHEPMGGTQLKAGVELALGAPIPPVRLGLTTGSPTAVPCREEMVLLCDGETEEGIGWVADFVRHVARPKGLVLHAVQVGGASDGALEALARLSGGKFVRSGK